MPVAIGTILFLNLMVLFARTGNRALVTIIGFIVVLLAVIVLHEFGHFITAKAFRIKVTEFFVGFGPRLWSTRRGETEYGIKAILAGGYVRIAGMNPFTEEPVEDQPRTFGAKPAWQRLIVLVSGVASHFVLAFVLLLVYVSLIGLPIFGASIDRVEETLNGRESPAHAAGLRPGDEVLAVDGIDRPSHTEFIEYTRAHVGQPIPIRVRRGEEVLTVVATPVLSDVEGVKVGRLGVILAQGQVVDRDRLGLGSAVTESGAIIGRGVTAITLQLGRVFGPEGISGVFAAIGGEDRPADSPVGIVGVGRAATQAANAGRFDDLFFFFIGTNLFIGILNILPLPPLDGGHVLLLGIEKIRGGRPVDIQKVIPVMAVVGGFLVLYTVLLLYLDIVNPIPNPFSP
jgi:membrane-associated protease RseP (regulator of RpoE activity)